MKIRFPVHVERDNRKKVSAWVLLCLGVLLTAGCQRVEKAASQQVVGPGYNPDNIWHEALIPISVRRVAVSVPSGAVDPVTAQRFQAVFLEELIRTGRFQAYAAVGSGSRSGGAADAVMSVEITTYSAHRPLQIGVRCLLVEPGSGRVWWAADESFSAGDQHVANAARRYAQRYLSDGYPAESAETILLSPTQFAHYAANALFSRIPPLGNPEESE